GAFGSSPLCSSRPRSCALDRANLARVAPGSAPLPVSAEDGVSRLHPEAVYLTEPGILQPPQLVKQTGRTIVRIRGARCVMVPPTTHEPAQRSRPERDSPALRARGGGPLPREELLYRGIGRRNDVGHQERPARFEARGHVPVEPAFLRVGEVMDDKR